MKRKNKKEINELAIHLFSRQEQFDRNGGGQWVCTHKVHKSKKTYDRKAKKKELKNFDYSVQLFSFCIIR